MRFYFLAEVTEQLIDHCHLIHKNNHLKQEKSVATLTLIYPLSKKEGKHMGSFLHS